ncbi:ORFb [Enterobacteria phage PR772]|uniref:ORFb n=1 Tax=Enterobacteria phage PR772 TaxID=261665 RepID=Q6EDY1_9VIRU|nr:ORFb [Enterobacteria phage PR772]
MMNRFSRLTRRVLQTAVILQCRKIRAITISARLIPRIRPKFSGL